MIELLNLRFVIYIGFAAFLALALWDVRDPEIIILVVLIPAAVAVSLKSVRLRIDRSFAKSTILTTLDRLWWNLFLAFLLTEVLLAVMDRVTQHPLLLLPNARSQERIEHYKNSLPDLMADDPRNSQGFNDSEWLIPKPRGTLRIVALGDSFAFGIVGYEGNFLTVLEDLLDQHLGGSIEICNLGLPALDPIDYLHIYTLEGRMLEPDLVLVCLFSGNDFVRRSRGSRLRLRNTRTFSVIWRLLRLHREWTRRQTTLRLSPLPAQANLAPASLSRKSFLEVAESYVEFLQKNSAAKTVRKVDETLAVLDDMANRVGKDRLIIALLPNEVQVNSDLRREVCRRLQISEAQLDLRQPGEWLRSHFEGQGVRVVDLLSSFVEAQRKSLTYEPNDTHWNRYGNQVAAIALKPHIEEAIRTLTGLH